MKNVAAPAQTQNGRPKRGRKSAPDNADGPRPGHQVDTVYTPVTLAKRWKCAAESILNLIRAGKLAAFTLSINRRRPRWRIAGHVVADFERGKPLTLPVKTSRRQAKDPDNFVKFF